MTQKKKDQVVDLINDTVSEYNENYDNTEWSDYEKSFKRSLKKLIPTSKVTKFNKGNIVFFVKNYEYNFKITRTRIQGIVLVHKNK